MLYLIAFLFAFSVSAATTPAADALARRMGMLDQPGEHRRMHRRTVSRGGGIAIVASLLLSMRIFGAYTHLPSAAYLGILMIFLLGLIDDLLSLPALFKLLLQLGVTALTLHLLRPDLYGPFFAAAMLWVLLLTNAHNMIDGMDGLMSGSAAIEAVFLFGILLLAGEGRAAIPPLLLCGACLGFRLFNRHPARIFAGDCGSLPVGFALGLFSLFLPSPSHPGAWGVPLFLFAYPLTDLCTAVLRRLLRMQNPFRADRAHLHHRIYDAGLPHRATVICLHLLTLGAGLVALSLLLPQSMSLASLSCLGVAALLVLMRHFIENFHQMG